MNELVHIYQNIPPHTWQIVLGAVGVSFVTQLLKKAARLENEKVIQVLFASVAFAASGLQYLTSSHTIPPDVLGIHTAVLVGLGSQLYTFVVKPLDNYVTQFKKVDLNAVADNIQNGTTNSVIYGTSNVPTSTITVSSSIPQQAVTTPPVADF